MRKITTITAIGVLALGSVLASDAEARSRNRAGAAVAAGIVGLAAGAIIAGSASRSYAAPAYGYSYPAHGYGSYDGGEYYARPAYRTQRVVRYYEEPRRTYRTRRVVRTYDHYGYSYAPRGSRTVTYSYGSPYYGGYGTGVYSGW